MSTRALTDGPWGEQRIVLRIDELRYVADRWRMNYNHYRPQSCLDYTAPTAFATMCLEQGCAPPSSRQGEYVQDTFITTGTEKGDRPGRATAILLGLAALPILFGVVLRNDSYGYNGDEFYYLACSEHLAWGYIDHPPLSIRASRSDPRDLGRRPLGAAPAACSGRGWVRFSHGVHGAPVGGRHLRPGPGRLGRGGHAHLPDLRQLLFDERLRFALLVPWRLRHPWHPQERRPPGLAPFRAHSRAWTPEQAIHGLLWSGALRGLGPHL